MNEGFQRNSAGTPDSDISGGRKSGPRGGEGTGGEIAPWESRSKMSGKRFWRAALRVDFGEIFGVKLIFIFEG